MARAISWVVVLSLLSTGLIPALPPQPGGIAVEGGADGFPGVEIARASLDDVCLPWERAWGVTDPGQLYAQSPGPHWGSIPGAAEGGIEAPMPAPADDRAAEDGEGGFSPQHLPEWSEMARCGAGGAYAGWPVAELPVWTPFGGAVGGGALPSHAFWPAWPGAATFTPGTFTPGSVIDRTLASPIDGDDGLGGDDNGGIIPVDDVTLVVAELTPGPTLGVIPEPGMLFLLGIAMVALGLLRRDWA